MKALIIALAVFFAASVCAQDSTMVRVTATGATPAKALDEARRKAVEQVSGIVVTSELEANRKRLVKDDIGNYSAGYVIKENIIKQTNMTEFWFVEAEIWVRPSVMANQKLNAGKDQKSFDGPTIGAQIKSYGESMTSAESLLTKIANDYPKRAFVIKTGAPQFSINQHRNPMVSIEYLITWNQDYLKSVREALSNMDVKGRTSSRILVRYKKPESIMLQEDTFDLPDIALANKFYSKVSGDVLFRAEFKDEDNNLIGALCYQPNIVWVNNYILHGNLRIRDTVNFEIRKDYPMYQNIEKVTKIEVTSWQPPSSGSVWGCWSGDR